MNQFLDQVPISEMDCKVEDSSALFVHCCEQPGNSGRGLRAESMSRKADSGSDEWSDMFGSNGPRSISNRSRLNQAR